MTNSLCQVRSKHIHAIADIAYLFMIILNFKKIIVLLECTFHFNTVILWRCDAPLLCVARTRCYNPCCLPLHSVSPIHPHALSSSDGVSVLIKVIYSLPMPLLAPSSICGSATHYLECSFYVVPLIPSSCI